jgi:hypothetical protein
MVTHLIELYKGLVEPVLEDANLIMKYVRSMLQICYKYVTHMLRVCYKYVTSMLQAVPSRGGRKGCDKGMNESRPLAMSQGIPTRVLQGCYKYVRSVLQGCHRVLQGCYKGMLYVCYKGEA